MQRINTDDGLFHEGNPTTGTKGTKLNGTWINEAQEEIIGVGGDIRTVAVETTLLETDGVIFVSAGAPIHLPIYGVVGSKKRYIIKNIEDPAGSDSVIDTTDGKTMDGEINITIAPQEVLRIIKDGANWQSI